MFNWYIVINGYPKLQISAYVYNERLKLKTILMLISMSSMQFAQYIFVQMGQCKLNEM
jgi:hypothetical protein